MGVAALGGLLFGYDTGVISGAILFIQKQFSLSATMEEIVVSSVLVGAVLGATIGGALTGRFGRRKMIILAGIIFTVSAIGTALAPTVGWLIAARVVSGIGIGIASFISPMYIAELVPAKVRGSLVAVNMLAITTGIVVAYLVDYAFSSSQGWRYMFGLAAIPSIALIIGMWWLPDSPRWLISKSKVEEARQVLQRVADCIGRRSGNHGHPEKHGTAGRRRDDRTAPAFSADAHDRRPRPGRISADNRHQHGHLLRPDHLQVRRHQRGRTRHPGRSGIDHGDVVFHVLAIFLLDRVGRRPLLLIGVAGQIVGLAILGAAFQFQQLASFKSDVAIGGLVIYVACFAFGLGPIFWLLISEIYPLKNRGVAMSAVTVTNWAMNLLVAVTFLTLVSLLGHAGTFWLYGIVAVGAWIFFYRLVPETKGKSLEQIEAHWRSGKIPGHYESKKAEVP